MKQYIKSGIYIKRKINRRVKNKEKDDKDYVTIILGIGLIIVIILVVFGK